MLVLTLTVSECPCTPMRTIYAGSTACAHLTSKLIHNVREPYMDKALCRTYYAMEATDFRNDFAFYSAKYNATMSTAAWLDKAGRCTIGNFPGSYTNTNGAYWRLGFKCNTTSGAWYNTWPAYDIDMKELALFAQLYTPK